MFEPLYVPDEEILENSLRREIEKFCFADTLLNRIVYDSVDTSPFTKDLEPKSYGLDVLPYYLPLSKDDTTLIFESRFESGNLRRAIQMYYIYDLDMSMSIIWFSNRIIRPMAIFSGFIFWLLIPGRIRNIG